LKNLVKTVEFDFDKDQAKQKWQEYCQYLKETKKGADKSIKVLKAAYYQISQGKQIIDIYETMKKAGKNEHDEPRLAICRANLKEVVFEKREKGAGAYWADKGWRYGSSELPQVAIPAGYFNEWRVDKIENKRFDGTPYITERIKEKSLSAPVPIIPIEYRPNGKLHNYFVLWEVDKWESEPPRDPFLLRRLSSNLFVILAAWDLTELERSVMKGAF